MNETASPLEIIAQLKDPKSSKRRDVAKKLSAFATPESVQALVELLADVEPSVQEVAIRSLIAIDGQCTVEKTIPLLLHELPAVRNAAVEVLEKIGSKHIGNITELLGSPNLDIRKYATDILGTLREPVAIPDLLRMLDDVDANVRSSAAEALGKMGDKSAGKAVLARLHKEKETWVIFHLIEALGFIASPWMVNELVSLASERDEVCREALMDTVGMVGGTENIADILSGFLKAKPSASGHLVQALVKIMARIGDESVLPQLQHHYSDFQAHLRFHLGQKDETQRLNALLLLGKLRRASVEELLGLTSDSSRDIRILALKTLDQQGLALTSDQWLNILKDPDPHVRFEAVGIVADELTPDLVKAMVEALPHEVELVQIAILRALVAQREARIFDFAKILANSESASLKDAAESVLRHLPMAQVEPS